MKKFIRSSRGASKISKQRYLDTKFWDDSYIIEQDPTEKLLFIYLLTNPLTNILGIYEISIKRIAFDSGIDKDMVIKILKGFEEDSKMKYLGGYVAIKNFVTHQKDNPKINAGIVKLLKESPPNLVEWANLDYKRLGVTKDEVLSQCKLYSVTEDIPSVMPTKKPADTGKILFNRKAGTLNIDKGYMTSLEKKYPNCNIPKEIAKMEGWLTDNDGSETRGKRTFIITWLDKAQKKEKEADERSPLLR